VVQKQPLNVYTVMLIVAFLALTIASLLLYLELTQWGSFPWWKAESGGAAAVVQPWRDAILWSPSRVA
jgi:hypothetical protein